MSVHTFVPGHCYECPYLFNSRYLGIVMTVCTFVTIGTLALLELTIPFSHQVTMPYLCNLRYLGIVIIVHTF